MGRYNRLILALLLLLVGEWYALPIFRASLQAWWQQLQTADVRTLSLAATNSLAYQINAHRWLEFEMPEGSQQLRIITNAHILPSEANTLNPNWAYALRYELLDEKNALIKSGVYHLRSRLTVYKDSQGLPINGNYYSSKAQVLLDGRLVLLGLQGLPNIAKLRLGLESLNPAITETAVRVYVPQRISEHQLATAWLRMSPAQKDNLAASSIYPAFLLSEKEKRNLLSHQWQPLGPLGIEGDDYQSQTLYSLNNKDFELYYPDALVLAAGLAASPQHHAAIPIQEQGGLVDLTLKALDGGLLSAPVTLDLQWYGREQTQRWRQTAVWTADSGNLSYPLDGGLLVIRPSAPVIINAYLTTGRVPKQEITDTLQSLKTYTAQLGVEYGVLHYQQQAADLRVDVRRLFTETAGSGTVHYHYLDGQGQVLANGELSATSQASFFDRIDPITDGKQISDASSYYFHLPPSAVRLRLSSDDPELRVSAYNQLYGYLKRQRVPEDAYITSNVDNDARDQALSWFPLRALNDEALAQQEGIQWVAGQYHPPEDNADLLAGHYLWQDYLPEGETSGYYLLTDYSGDEPRTDALANVYCPVAVHQDNPVSLEAFEGLRSISPELIFMRPSPAPFSAEFLMDGQKIDTLASMGLQGVVRLPETLVGPHRLRINTNSGGRWLMNQQRQCTGQRYLKRRVFALKPDAPLEFIVTHGAGDETFSAHWYSPETGISRSQLKLEILAVAPSAPKATVNTNWTYQNRLYDIRALPDKRYPVLFTQGQQLSNGERFAIPINSDLPAGAYRIRISLAQGPAGAITLSQIKPGTYEQRRFYRETGLEKP